LSSLVERAGRKDNSLSYSSRRDSQCRTCSQPVPPTSFSKRYRGNALCAQTPLWRPFKRPQMLVGGFRRRPTPTWAYRGQTRGSALGSLSRLSRLSHMLADDPVLPVEVLDQPREVCRLAALWRLAGGTPRVPALERLLSGLHRPHGLVATSDRHLDKNDDRPVWTGVVMSVVGHLSATTAVVCHARCGITRIERRLEPGAKHRLAAVTPR
jgi:hypothetical protein